MKNIRYLILILLTFASCATFNGSYDLGANLYLLEGDRIEDRIIVYCTKKDNEYCNGGTYVIPISYDDHMKKGKYSQYVLEAKSDENGIIAKTFKIKENKIFFWIINLKEKGDNVYGPLSYKTFLEKKQRFKIDLSFNNTSAPAP